MSYKISQTFSLESLSEGTNEDLNGRIFINPSAMVDLSPVLICGAFVDTVRQLFHGIPSVAMMNKLQQHVENKDDIISLYDVVYPVLPGTIPRFVDLSPVVTRDKSYDQWHFCKMGKNSGFRYKIQNNQIGIVILFGSYYGTLDNEGQHLKIELSPHFISSRTPVEIWQYLHSCEHSLSKLFINEPVPQGVAVHLACDYQNHNLPLDFLSRFTTNSRTVRVYDGISELDLSNISEAAVTYGSENQAKNYMIGKPTAIQFAAYDKGYEAVKSDKIDYLHEQWGIFTEGEHNPQHVTRRIELRFHHTVIREIGNGLGLSFESFPEILPYFTDLWRYGLERNRLNQNKTYIDPFWQLLLRDVQFTLPAQNIIVSRKKKESVDPIAHNIASIIGHSISICARKGMTTNRFMAYLRTLPFYPEIISYYRNRGQTEEDLKMAVAKGLALRRLIGSAA